MARPNPEKNPKKTPVLQYVIFGVLIVIIIVALYYGFFVGQAEEFEQQEDPAQLEQRISGLSLLINSENISKTIFSDTLTFFS